MKPGKTEKKSFIIICNSKSTLPFKNQNMGLGFYVKKILRNTKMINICKYFINIQLFYKKKLEDS